MLLRGITSLVYVYSSHDISRTFNLWQHDLFIDVNSLRSSACSTNDAAQPPVDRMSCLDVEERRKHDIPPDSGCAPLRLLLQARSPVTLAAESNLAHAGLLIDTPESSACSTGSAAEPPVDQSCLDVQGRGKHNVSPDGGCALLEFLFQAEIPYHPCS